MSPCGGLAWKLVTGKASVAGGGVPTACLGPRVKRSGGGGDTRDVFRAVCAGASLLLLLLLLLPVTAGAAAVGGLNLAVDLGCCGDDDGDVAVEVLVLVLVLA
jgi:hypothetical protein